MALTMDDSLVTKVRLQTIVYAHPLCCQQFQCLKQTIFHHGYLTNIVQYLSPLELHVYHNVIDDASLSETTRIKRWNDDCSQTFVSTLNTDTIDVVLSNMTEVDIVDKDSINKINNDIAAVIFEAAEKACGTSKRTKK